MKQKFHPQTLPDRTDFKPTAYKDVSRGGKKALTKQKGVQEKQVDLLDKQIQAMRPISQQPLKELNIGKHALYQGRTDSEGRAGNDSCFIVLQSLIPVKAILCSVEARKTQGPSTQSQTQSQGGRNWCQVGA